MSNRGQETRLAAPGPEAPRTTPKRHTPPRQPQPAAAPHLRRPFRAYTLGYTFLSPVGSDAPPRASAPAAAGASPRPPLAPWVRTSPAPPKRCERPQDARNAPRRTRPRRTSNHPEPPRSATLSRASRSQPPAPHLRRPFRAYILGYTSLSPTGSDAPPRASAPAAASASRPLALRRGQEGSAPLPRRKSLPGADLFRRPYLGTTAFFIPLTLSMAYRTASMVWLSWSGYRGRTRPLRSRSYS